MRNAVIVDSVRTGLAKSFRGGFNNTRADNMTAHIVNALLERNPKVEASMVEDIILGCGSPEGAQGHNIARNVAVLSNLPIETGGVTINRYCSSGLNSIAMAATQIQSGFYDCIIAGGVESISTTQGKGNMHMYVNEKLAEEVPGIYHAMAQRPRLWQTDIVSLEKHKMSMLYQVNKDVQQPKMLDYTMTKLFLWILR